MRYYDEHNREITKEEFEAIAERRREEQQYFSPAYDPGTSERRNFRCVPLPEIGPGREEKFLRDCASDLGIPAHFIEDVARPLHQAMTNPNATRDAHTRPPEFKTRKVTT